MEIGILFLVHWFNTHLFISKEGEEPPLESNTIATQKCAISINEMPLSLKQKYLCHFPRGPKIFIFTVNPLFL